MFGTQLLNDLHDFKICKVLEKLKFQKMSLRIKYDPNSIFFNETNNKKDSDNFWLWKLEISIFQSPAAKRPLIYKKKEVSSKSDI